MVNYKVPFLLKQQHTYAARVWPRTKWH